jgi:anti-sigma regulatory factor (Ser/Thr protein kinase)
MRYEAAANVAYHGHDVAVLCPYDAARLPADLLEAALETHPEVVDAGGTRGNERFVDPRTYLRRRAEVVEAPAGVAPHRIKRAEDIALVRAIVAEQARVAGLDPLSVEELALAVSEVVTNALVHGRAPRHVWSYIADGRFVCRLEDAGSGLRDPLSGYLPPHPTKLGGRGLWLARQLCDVVEIASDEAGTIVSLQVRLPAA